MKNRGSSSSLLGLAALFRQWSLRPTARWWITRISTKRISFLHPSFLFCGIKEFCTALRPIPHHPDIQCRCGGRGGGGGQRRRRRRLLHSTSTKKRKDMGVGGIFHFLFFKRRCPRHRPRSHTGAAGRNRSPLFNEEWRLLQDAD